MQIFFLRYFTKYEDQKFYMFYPLSIAFPLESEPDHLPFDPWHLLDFSVSENNNSVCLTKWGWFQLLSSVQSLSHVRLCVTP